MNNIWIVGKYHPNLLKNQPEKVTRPMRITFENENENENEKQIKQISSSSYSTIFLFENGKAIEYLNEKQKPQKIQIEENIQKVTVGFGNEAILTIEGNVFAKGKDIISKNPKEFINISLLIEDTNDRKIEDIVCGRSSIYLLTSNRNAYGIGSNDHGQLGFDYETLEKTEKPILMMKNVSKIFSGNSSKYVFLLNSNQELFGCGDNKYGQLGLGESITEQKIKQLTKIEDIPKGEIIDIQCGCYHSIIKLYSCGNSQFNAQYGYRDSKKFTEIKSSLFENDQIRVFSVGTYHTLILTYNGKMIGFGVHYFPRLPTDTYSYFDYNQIAELEPPKFIFDISNYQISCGDENSFLYYSPFLSNLEEDLIKLFRRKEFCNLSFKTENGEIIEAHKLILKYRLKDQNQIEIEKLQKIISNKSIQESNQIFEMIYSNNSKINPKLYSEIKEIINSNESIEETMKRIYLNENDFIIERKEKQYKFPKLILIMRSELYRGMFLAVTDDTSSQNLKLELIIFN
ncbi:hypothetical protein M0811_12991 [Anaeramoeba ignava]|uniref:Uncharacterized protein n=1 Tax=Anaeramoeba ignava TaxID=1746090 RepID=A0A9Q0L756_ANAIG|nr:hypothetical protein M0811_12991 [Anaeramoeba ignava]